MINQVFTAICNILFFTPGNVRNATLRTIMPSRESNDGILETSNAARIVSSSKEPILRLPFVRMRPPGTSRHVMHREPAARTIRMIGGRSMQQHAVMKGAAPRRHDNGSLPTAIKQLIWNLFVRSIADRPFLAVVQNLAPMTSGDDPHAAILLRHVIKRGPARDQIERLNREVGGILVIGLLHAPGRLHETLAAVELDVRTDQ